MLLQIPSFASTFQDDSGGVRAVRTHGYRASKPPSMVSRCPVTNEAASEHSQTTAAAISSGHPTRPIGYRAVICAAA
jgi:hypothetical protein